MNVTYKAVEVTSPGVFTLVERPVPNPAHGQVRIRVEACGVCHSDAATVLNQFPGLTYPRVPGHEVIGTIEELGAEVDGWAIGQRVGVGFFGGQDGVCEPCLRGDFVNCLHPVIPGITTDGGYAEVMIAEARALALIPKELTAAEAAPLVCAGITTFNALRNAGLRSGATVAPGRRAAVRRALNVVIPAHTSGAASAAVSSFGINARARASAIITSA